MILPLVDARWRCTTRYPGVLRGASYTPVCDISGALLFWFNRVASNDQLMPLIMKILTHGNSYFPLAKPILILIYYCIRHIFRGVFIFANFASRVLVANLTTRENIYLRSGRMNATCVLLLDREFNHSRKCLEVPIREKLDSRNI